MNFFVNKQITQLSVAYIYSIFIINIFVGKDDGLALSAFLY